MRAALIAGTLVTLALVLGMPPAPAVASCANETCGVPSCWQPSVRVRPDMTRAVRAYCTGAVSARVLTQPAHGEITNVSTEYSSVRFDAHLSADSPRFDEAVFELTGHEGTIEQRVSIEVVPTSENSPPVCDGDRLTQRSDGSGPVHVFLRPWCRDPDGDEFVIEGGGPGVHPQSPKSVPAGETDSNWDYRTATFSGQETATIAATDVLGARSDDAELDVTVGPTVEQPPGCGITSSPSSEVVQIYSRPGAIRRFAVICSDPDGDPYTGRLSSPPERGTMTLFDTTNPRYPDWGGDRWFDATYVASDASLEPDPFSVTATSASGDGPAARMAIVPREPPANSGAGCSYGPDNIAIDTPGELKLNCDDGDGDPLSITVVTEPRHGTLGPAVNTPAEFGETKTTIPYVPNAGYEGYDCVKVTVDDGHGIKMDLTFDIWVRPKPPPVSFPVMPPLPPLPPIEPGATPEDVRTVVERALGTTAVRRVRTTGGLEVWKRSTLSRHDLLRYGRAPGMVVVCPKRCHIRSLPRLLGTRVRTVRASRQKFVVSATSNQPQVLSLALSRAERRALRRSRKARARFDLSIRATGGHAKSLAPSILVSR